MAAASSRWSVYGALAACGALVLAAPAPAASLRVLTGAGDATQVTAPVVALLALLAWGCAAYLLLVAALVLGSRLPGLLGRALSGVARVSAPAGLRRTLEVALAGTLVVGALGGTASAASPAPQPGGQLVVHTELQAPTGPPPVVAPAPTLQAPSGDHSHTPSATLTPPTVDTGPAALPDVDLDWPVDPASPPEPAVVPAAAAASVPAAAPATEGVVVRPGDSLWSLAQERLGPEATDAQVAAAWPSWWQANRDAIGEDPDLLRPGTPLVPPGT